LIDTSLIVPLLEACVNVESPSHVVNVTLCQHNSFVSCLRPQQSVAYGYACYVGMTGVTWLSTVHFIVKPCLPCPAHSPVIVGFTVNGPSASSACRQH